MPDSLPSRNCAKDDDGLKNVDTRAVVGVGCRLDPVYLRDESYWSKRRDSPSVLCCPNQDARLKEDGPASSRSIQ